MKWPWRRSVKGERLIVACTADSFAYVQADIEAGPPYAVKRMGLELRGNDDDAAFVRRLRALKLPQQDVIAVLPLSRTQIYQVEAPAVHADELKGAARFLVKDLVDCHIGDLTLDVMRVGDERPRTRRQLFVVTARNSAIAESSELLQAMGLDSEVIDICETAQRNLQTALAAAQGHPEQATAALMVYGSGQCLLTISANDELFYTRRLDWSDEIFGSGANRPRATHGQAHGPSALSQQALEAVDIVDYGVDAPEFGAAEGAPRMVAELQRSFDVWNRSWPDLRLAGLTVHAGDKSAALAGLVKREVAMPVEPMNLSALFSGLDAYAHEARLQEACVPLLGALLRKEVRKF